MSLYYRPVIAPAKEVWRDFGSVEDSVFKTLAAAGWNTNGGAYVDLHYGDIPQLEILAVGFTEELVNTVHPHEVILVNSPSPYGELINLLKQHNNIQIWRIHNE